MQEFGDFTILKLKFSHNYCCLINTENQNLASQTLCKLQVDSFKSSVNFYVHQSDIDQHT